MMVWLLSVALAQSPPERVPVVVAGKDLPVGVPIEEGHLYTVPMDRTFAPKQAISGEEYVIDRMPVTPIFANEAIREERRVDHGRHRGLQAQVPRGYRAMSVQLAAPPEVLPETHVDILIPSDDGRCVLADDVYVLEVAKGAGPREFVVAVKGEGVRRLLLHSELYAVPRPGLTSTAGELCTGLEPLHPK